MPQRDIYHQAVKQALINDGWVITHDPFPIYYGRRRGYVDLGAEEGSLAAEKEGRKIAVEVKSFVSDSIVADIEQAVGQYLVYRSWLRRLEPSRELFLAVSYVVAADAFDDMAGQALIEDYQLRIIVVDMTHKEIVQWIG
jgi:hypothetical protein